LAQVESQDLEVRIAACQALAASGDPACLEALTERLDDGAWQVRARAALLLGKASCAAAAGRLRSALEDRAWWVRYNAGQALARLGEEGAAALQVALGSTDPFARDMAAQWLDELTTGALQ